MIDLMEKSPCDGGLPMTYGNTTLSELPREYITAIQSRQGQEQATNAALKTAHGLAFPAPNRATGRVGCRAIWTSHAQAFLLGPAPDGALGRTAALTDQSDGWAVFLLEGAGARDVLARLCPLDLRPNVFKRGHTARSLIGHMNGSVTRISAHGYLVLVFRSMAITMMHETGAAMKSVAAQARA